MATTADFRNGLCIKLDNSLYKIVSFEHVKPGKGGAFVRTKLKNVVHDGVIEKTFNAGVKIVIANIERRKFQFVYHDDKIYYFMDEKTFDTVPLHRDLITGTKWLLSGQKVNILMHEEEEKILRCEVPQVITLRIEETEEGVEGNTANKALKSAVVESGEVVQVPLFIKKGDEIKIDTHAGKYVDRVQKA